MNAVFLFADTDYPHFAKQLDDVINIDYIFCLRKKNELQSDKRYIYGVSSIFNILEDKCLKKLFFFDFYSLLIAEIVNRKHQYSIETIYIQHGYLDLTPNSGIFSKFVSFYNNAKIYLSYLRITSFSFFRIYLILSNFLFGGYRALALYKDKVEFDAAFFWDNESMEKFCTYQCLSFKKKYVVGGPDEFPSKLKYDPNGPALYIMQPMVETKHLTDARFNELLNKVSSYSKETGLILLKHPKQKNQNWEEFGICYSKVDFTVGIGVSKIIGHFSSLLLYSYGDIPVEIKHFDFCELIEKTQNFSLERERCLTTSNALFFDEIRNAIIS